MSTPVPEGRGHVVLSHTADTGIEAWAPDLESLFEECAAAMFALMYPRADPLPSPHIAVEAAGNGVEELLVAWLSELLYIAEVSEVALCAFRVDSLTSTRVRGRAAGPPVSEIKLFGPPIKAVTYHGLTVACNGSCRARVIVDV
jgi:SHS2 domain-containing protein